MDIIHEYVWYALGAAGFLGFVFAWIVRGIAGSAKRRRATVERDVALTELEQVRSELDSLYAAQRKQKEASASSSAVDPEDIRERDERLSRMAEELESAKAELQELRQTRHEGGEVSQQEGDETSDLKARNEYLEERVGELETRLHDMAEQPASPDTDTSTGTGGEDDADGKLDWQVGYLKSRVETLEQKLVDAESGAGAVAETVPDPAADEELARLRWRNRYLEGRLAYFEESPGAGADAAPKAAGSENNEPADVADAPGEDVQQDAGETETEDTRDEAHPSDAFLKALDSTDKSDEAAETGSDDDAANADAGTDPAETGQAPAAEAPPSLDKPDGEADDLTLITGIGPRIQTILNDLGIWHFSQIAAWSSGHEAWVDEQLNFAGRVGRERWVEQAQELVSADKGDA